MTQSPIITTLNKQTERTIMPRIEVTKAEHAVLKQALETFNDMNNDMLFEDVSVNLFPRGDAETTFNAQQGTNLRDELCTAFEQLANIRSLLTKVGSKVNENGYSI